MSAVAFSGIASAHDPGDDNSSADTQSQPLYDPANDPLSTALGSQTTNVLLGISCSPCSVVSGFVTTVGQVTEVDRHPDRPAPDPLATVHEAEHQSHTANTTEGAPRGSTNDGIADSPQTEVVTTVDPFSPLSNSSPTYNASIENNIPDCTTETVYEWGVVEEKRDWRGEVYFTVYGHVPAGTVTVCE